MAFDDLAGVRGKLSRAKEHLDDIYAAVYSWSLSEEAKHSVPDIKYETDGKYIYALLGKVSLIERPDIGLLIGDFVHNLRSALDHVVAQMAWKRDSTFDGTKTAFPITLTRGEFKNSIRRSLEPFLSDQAITTAFESYQPYKTEETYGTPAREAILYIVSELDNIDKHRKLVVATQSFKAANTRLTVKGRDASMGEVISAWQPLKEGAILSRFKIPEGGLRTEDEMNVEAETVTQITIQQSGLVIDGVPVEQSIAVLYREIVRIIDECERRFF
jgi:hypothetical protein